MSNSGQLRVIIAGGGTGGHLFPALAIAQGLQARNPDAEIHFMGSQYGIEARVLPERNLPHTLLNVRGFQRGLDFTSLGRNLLFAPRFLGSYIKAKSTINRINPSVVVGTGGYASGLPLLAAVRRKTATLIQEQNSYPGFTTRWLADRVDKICIAFDDARAYIPADKTILTGNPVRKNIASGTADQAAIKFNLDPTRPVLFLFGGSQGSAILNHTMAAATDKFADSDVQILWQTGQLQFEQYENFNSGNIRVLPFIDEMNLAYALATLVISRAGALTLAEITSCGLPSILVPLPSAAADHQTRNANALVTKQAALAINESQLTPELLVNQISDLLNDTNRLNKMSTAAGKLARSEATESIVNEILELAQA